MNRIKYKLLIFLATFLGITGYMSLVSVPEVSASDLNYAITCKDGSKKLDTETNRSNHKVTVKCKSGAKFTYELGDNGQNLVKLSCPREEKPVTEVRNDSTELVAHCAIFSGTPDNPQFEPTDSNPAVETSVNRDYDPDGSDTNDCAEDGCVDVGTDFDPDDCTDGLDGDCEVVDIIVVITNTLAALAATVIVAMIIWGGIQYSMAGADAAKVQAAKQKIMNALIALLLLIFGFSIIQWLVPGGLI